jgi:hypothetical protein
VLTTHPLLVSRSRECRAIPLLPPRGLRDCHGAPLLLQYIMMWVLITCVFKLRPVIPVMTICKHWASVARCSCTCEDASLLQRFPYPLDEWLKGGSPTHQRMPLTFTEGLSPHFLLFCQLDVLTTPHARTESKQRQTEIQICKNPKSVYIKQLRSVI